MPQSPKVVKRIAAPVHIVLEKFQPLTTKLKVLETRLYRRNLLCIIAHETLHERKVGRLRNGNAAQQWPNFARSKSAVTTFRQTKGLDRNGLNFLCLPYSQWLLLSMKTLVSLWIPWTVQPQRGLCRANRVSNHRLTASYRRTVDPTGHVNRLIFTNALSPSWAYVNHSPSEMGYKIFKSFERTSSTPAPVIL